jgi:hypothetical protein
LFQYLDQNPTEFVPTVIQLATWAINGNVSASHIAEKFPFGADDKSNACLLMRKAGIDTDNKALCSE